MKKSLLTLCLFITGWANAQTTKPISFTPDLSNPKFEKGKWTGELNAGGMLLAITLNVFKYPIETPELKDHAQIDVPLQGVTN